MIQSVKMYLEEFSAGEKIGKGDERILNAMERVDRKNFVENDFEQYAYVDDALPTEKGQTISQPSTAARMLSLLELKKGDSVLEVGAGSGWSAALIGFIISEGDVLSLEIVDELRKRAKKRIAKLGIKNVKISGEDFRNVKEKFDKIVFTAGISREQEGIIEKFARKSLKENGILVCPFQSGPFIVLRNYLGKITKDYTKEEYVFVPLVL